MFSPFPGPVNALFCKGDIFVKLYLSSFINNNKIHLSPDLFWIEENQHGLSTAGKMQI